MVPSIKPAIIKESFKQKKSEQNQRQNLIVDIAVNRCLLRTIELKLFCFNKTPEVEVLFTKFPNCFPRGHISEFIYQNIGCNLLGKWGRECS